jgi:hypothetical protein
MNRLLRVLCLALLLTAVLPIVTPAQAGNSLIDSIVCRGQPTVLTRSVTNVNLALACHTIALGKGSTSVRLDLTANSGAYDLYVKAGNATSFTGADKVNPQAVKSSLNYIVANARSSTYTIAVVRTGRSGTFNLSSTANSGASSSCSGKTCRMQASLVPRKAGDQTIYRVDIAATGTANAQVSWQPSAAKLSASLNGSSAPGAQPLKLKSNATKGRPLSLVLVNVSGAVSGGQVSITYPQ